MNRSFRYPHLFLVLILLCAHFVLIGVFVIIWSRGDHTVDELQYLTAYWYSAYKQNWPWFMVLSAAYGASAYIAHHFLRETIPLHSRLFTTAQKRRKYNQWLQFSRTFLVACVFLFALLVPSLYLRGATVALFYAMVPILPLAVIYAFTSNSDPTAIQRLGTNSFPSASFNVAALAPLSSEVETKLKDFLQVRLKGSISNDSGTILEAAKDIVFRSLRSILAVEDERNIRLAFNTTSAIRIAIEEVRQHSLSTFGKLPVIVTTDAEYPGVAAICAHGATKIHVKATDFEGDALHHFLRELKSVSQTAYLEGFEAFSRQILSRGTDTEFLNSLRFLEQVVDDENNGPSERFTGIVRKLLAEVQDLEGRGEPESALTRFLRSFAREPDQFAQNALDLYASLVRLHLDAHSVCIVIEVNSLIQKNELSQDKLAEIIAHVSEEARSATSRPSLVVTASVHWGSGFVFDHTLLNRHQTFPGTAQDSGFFLVLDAAQAVGHLNIIKKQEDWDQITFLAGCGHKWLLGKETLGFLVKGPKFRTSETTVPDGSMFSSRDSFYGGLGGTVSVESFVGLSESIQEIDRIGMEEIENHNSNLARLFVQAVNSVEGVTAMQFSRRSSIVLLKMRMGLGEFVQREYSDRYHNVIARAHFGSDAEDTDSYFMRFCFHYFHSDSDVLQLVENIEAIVLTYYRHSMSR